MNRNYSTSPAKSESESMGSCSTVRICGLPTMVPRLHAERQNRETQFKGAQEEQSGQWFHRWGNFYHFTANFHNTNPSNSALHLGMLRVCRQIYIETTLLPYTLNTFTFKDDSIRDLFEQSAQPGKKKVQKAVGKYEIGSYSELSARHRRGMRGGASKDSILCSQYGHV